MVFDQSRVLRLLALVLVGVLVGTVGHGGGANSPDSWPLSLGWGNRAVQASPGEELVRPVDPSAAQFPDQPIDQPAETLAPRPGRRPTQPVTVPAPRERRGSLTSPILSQPPAPDLNDPAQQVAPAVIELSPGNRPLSLVVSLAMRQQLQNLDGPI
ncbi:MAG: hypothetical protein HC922_03185 [Leptolyngbyaceae cyanobacterium SM2_3_12]|nr:hypothetical protein [Leptolyngbyaceae cyanobacterium SM2_3_12]